jgi:hypothetical protein
MSSKDTNKKSKDGKSKDKIPSMKNTTITITFGDQAENHVGMQKIGKLAEEGFSINDIKRASKKFKKLGAECIRVDLSTYAKDENNVDEDSVDEDSVDEDSVDEDNTDDTPDAQLLIIRNGLSYISDPDQLYKEQFSFNWDTKAKMRGSVVNKAARHNVCYAKKSQEPDYENGKGTIVAFNDLPYLSKLHAILPEYFGNKAKNLQAEGNKYYDISNKCYIGFHGDSERRIVIGCRLGATLPLHYQWYQQSNPIGTRYTCNIHHGDIYMMSEKAVGTDWKKRIIKTLRHAAGNEDVLVKKTKCVLLDTN